MTSSLPARLASHDVKAGALLLALAVMFFWKVVLNPSHLVEFNEIVRQLYPWRSFAYDASNGNPLWLPHTSAGEPVAANPMVALFYPIDAVLFRILPTHLAFGYGSLLHVFLAGLFTYLLCRHLVGNRASSLAAAGVFMFSQFIVGHTYAGHYSLVAAAAWLPMTFYLLVLAVKTRSIARTLLTAVALGIQFLAGHPQIVALTLLFLSLFAVARAAHALHGGGRWDALRAPLVLGAAVIVALGLAAVQLVPTAEFAAQSTRSGGMGYQQSSVYSLPFHALIGVLLPNAFGTPLDGSHLNSGPYWEFALYTGVLPPILVTLMFCLSGRRRVAVFLMAAAAFFLMLAFGGHTPFYPLVWSVIPGFSGFRVPARAAMIVSFCVALLTGFALARLSAPLTATDVRRIRAAAWVLALAAIAAAVAVLAGVLAREWALDIANQALARMHQAAAAGRPLESYARRLAPAYSAALRDGAWLAALAGVAAVLLRWRTSTTDSRRWTWTMAGVALANLWVFHAPFVQTAELSSVYPTPAYLLFLKQHAGPHRVYDRNFVLKHNAQVVHGVHTISGYNPLRLSDYDEVVWSLRTSPVDDIVGVLRVLNVKYILTTGTAESDRFRRVFAADGVAIYENLDPVAAAYVVPESELTTFGTLTAADARKRAGLLADTSDVSVLSSRPDEVIVDASLTHPGVLVLADVYYPGWHAYEGGERREIIRAYGVLRAVRLRPGRHRLRFVFEPATLRVGMALSAVVSTLTLLALLWSARSGRQSAAVAGADALSVSHAVHRP